MQPKQMTPRQMTQHQIKPKQMQTHQMQSAQFAPDNDLFSRTHGQHEHTMTLSNPQKDNRQMFIPNSTFESDEAKAFSMPFRYLRTWIFSLLALVALPIGFALIMIGTSIADAGDTWEAQTAEVVSHNESGVVYRVEGGRRLGSSETSFGYELDDFVSVDGTNFVFRGSACDLVSRFIIPNETGAEFTVWSNPATPNQHSCIELTPENGSLILVAGWVLVALAGIRLLRTINDAAIKPRQV